LGCGCLNYDNFVFDQEKTGTYLPLSRLGPQGQFNYADNIPLFSRQLRGSVDHSNQAEAINILPAIVGASLVGIDKSNQSGVIGWPRLRISSTLKMARMYTSTATQPFRAMIGGTM